MARPCDKEFKMHFGYGELYPLTLAHLTRDHKHHGLDYLTETGTPIYCPVEAVLSEFGYKEFYGFYVVGKFWKTALFKKEQYRFILMHLSQTFLKRVKVGDWMKENQVIALSGDSGSAKNHPHLHLELQRFNGSVWTHLDPALVIKDVV
jgi:murein DD-endopeptidase MepM/ murein hydrolase activator NlpD